MSAAPARGIAVVVIVAAMVPAAARRLGMAAGIAEPAALAAVAGIVVVPVARGIAAAVVVVAARGSIAAVVVVIPARGTPARGIAVVVIVAAVVPAQARRLGMTTRICNMAGWVPKRCISASICSRYSPLDRLGPCPGSKGFCPPWSRWSRRARRGRFLHVSFRPSGRAMPGALGRAITQPGR